MPNLKDLKVRINSVKSTQKITSAMKMVAAAKLRRAQESAEAARPYAEKMERMVADVGESIGGIEGAPPLLVGTGSTQIHLIAAPDPDAAPADKVSPINNHTAFAIDDYETTRDYLRSKGLAVLETNHEQGQMWVADPSGNVIEFTTGNTVLKNE